MAVSNEEAIALLTQAYSMELETVMNYLANSINLDGVRAEEIKKSLAADITEEIGHAQQLGQRIKQLGGQVPGSKAVQVGQQQQPPADTTDVVAVIKGVIDAESANDHKHGHQPQRKPDYRNAQSTRCCRPRVLGQIRA